VILRDPTGSLDGWRCRPVSHITGRLETIADGSLLVLAWPDHPPPVQAKLVFVPAEWIVGDDPMEDDGK
jgi:hypothetical protein